MQHDEVVERPRFSTGDCRGQAVTAAPHTMVAWQKGSIPPGRRARTNSVKGVDEGDLGFLVERETETTEPSTKRFGRRAREKRVLSMSEPSQLSGGSDRPLPNLFARLVARVDQDVLVNCPRDLPLCAAKYAAVEKKATIAHTMENLKYFEFERRIQN